MAKSEEKRSNVLLLSVGSVVVLLFVVTTASAQTAASPSRTQCKQWDDAFLALFDWGLGASFLVTLILSIMAGFLGRFSWIAASPYKRIFVVGGLCLVGVALGVPLWPWMFGFRAFWFSGIDPRYFDCSNVQFGANGLLGGLISPGIPAVAQWPVMILALSCSTVLGGLLAAAMTSFINSRTGVPASVGGEV